MVSILGSHAVQPQAAEVTHNAISAGTYGKVSQAQNKMTGKTSAVKAMPWPAPGVTASRGEGRPLLMVAQDGLRLWGRAPIGFAT